MQQKVSTKFGMLFAALCAALSLMLVPQLAYAHDVLTESTPERDSTVETTPSEVRLQFSGQPLDGQGLTNLIRITDEQGNQWQDGDVVVEGYDLAIPTCEGMPQGDYTVAYRVVYSDGHTGEESFSFTNADPSAPAEGTPQDCGEAVAGAEQETAPSDEENASTDNETVASDEDTQTPSDADEAGDGQTATSVPTWVWVAGGVGLLVVAGIVFLVMRGSRTTGESEAPAED